MKRPNIQRCRTLRKQQTDAEKKLWKILRARQLTGAKFRRQFSIGHYILDFYSPKYKLGIETDGGQHYQEEGKYKDRIRTANLQKTGVAILRFSDSDILNNIEGVWEIICRELDKKKTLLPHTSPPQPAPSPPREKE
jgi:very-short-patch-repair endonuclease